MSNLTILKTSIRTYENLYSLNDLHLVSGGEDKHRPTFFIRLDTTKELVKEIESENSDVQICTSIKSLRTGINKGTWACEELALAYATWISPKFHLVVLRAFIAMHKGENLQNSQPNLSLATITPKQQHYIQEIVQGVHKESGLSHAEIYSRLKNKFKVAKYDQLPQSEFKAAVDYLIQLPFANDHRLLRLSIHEVLPLAMLLSKVNKLMIDFEIIHKYLRTKDVALADVVRNHLEQLNVDSPLFRHGQSAISGLIKGLPEADQNFIYDIAYR